MVIPFLWLSNVALLLNSWPQCSQIALCTMSCIFFRWAFMSTTNRWSGQCIHWIRLWMFILWTISASMVVKSSPHSFTVHTNFCGRSLLEVFFFFLNENPYFWRRNQNLKITHFLWECRCFDLFNVVSTIIWSSYSDSFSSASVAPTKQILKKFFVVKCFKVFFYRPVHIWGTFRRIVRNHHQLQQFLLWPSMMTKLYDFCWSVHKCIRFASRTHGIEPTFPNTIDTNVHRWVLPEKKNISRLKSLLLALISATSNVRRNRIGNIWIARTIFDVVCLLG